MSWTEETTENFADLATHLDEFVIHWEVESYEQEPYSWGGSRARATDNRIVHARFANLKLNRADMVKMFGEEAISIFEMVET